MKKAIIYGLLMIGTVFLIWSSYGGDFFFQESAGRTWVQIDPVQCSGNPWEIEQREKGVAFDKSEDEIIKDYFQIRGVQIFEVRSKMTHEIVCESCACLRGDTLYLSVASPNVSKMLNLGYKVSEEKDVPKVE